MSPFLIRLPESTLSPIFQVGSVSWAPRNSLYLSCHLLPPPILWRCVRTIRTLRLLVHEVMRSIRPALVRWGRCNSRPQTGWFQQQTSMSGGPGGQKSKIMGFWCGFSSWLVGSDFLMLSSWSRGREKALGSLCAILGATSKPNSLSETPPLNTIGGGAWDWVYEFSGDTIQATAASISSSSAKSLALGKEVECYCRGPHAV